MNPQVMQLLAQLRQSSNPQEMLYGLMEKGAQGNPIYSNILNLAKENKFDEIEQIARNIAKEKGIDFDKEFTSFKQMFGA